MLLRSHVEPCPGSLRKPDAEGRCVGCGDQIALHRDGTVVGHDEPSPYE